MSFYFYFHTPVGFHVRRSLWEVPPSSFRDFPLARARDAETWAPGGEERCGFLWHAAPALSSAAIQLILLGRVLMLPSRWSTTTSHLSYFRAAIISVNQFISHSPLKKIIQTPPPPPLLVVDIHMNNCQGSMWLFG